MRKCKSLTIVFVALLSVFMLFSYVPVRADSGWDSDYDSGDWGSSDSSWDRDYGSSDGSYSSGSDGAVGFVIALILIIIFIVYLSSRHSAINQEFEANLPIVHFPWTEDIQKMLPEYTLDSLSAELYQTFLKVQAAWMNFDYNTLSDLCVEELYQSYRSDLEILMAQNRQNIMYGFENGAIYIQSIQKENNQIVVTALLGVSFYDYVINRTTGKVVRGKKNVKLNNGYMVTFVRDATVGDRSICPNCGAKVDGAVCSYCHSPISKKHSHFMLSKKGKTINY